MAERRWETLEREVISKVKTLFRGCHCESSCTGGYQFGHVHLHLSKSAPGKSDVGRHCKLRFGDLLPLPLGFSP